MSEKRVCVRCGKGYWPNQAWHHENRLCEQSEAAEPEKSLPGSPRSAPQEGGMGAGMVVHDSKVVHKAGSSRHGKYADLDVRKAYRRDWMRRRRADKRAGA